MKLKLTIFLLFFSMILGTAQSGKVYGDLSFFLFPEKAHGALSLGYTIDEQWGIGVQYAGISQEITSFSGLALEGKWMKDKWMITLGLGMLSNYEETPEVQEFRYRSAFNPFLKLNIGFRIWKFLVIGATLVHTTPVEGDIYQWNEDTDSYSDFVRTAVYEQDSPIIQPFIGLSFPIQK